MGLGKYNYYLGLLYKNIIKISDNNNYYNFINIFIY